MAAGGSDSYPAAACQVGPADIGKRVTVRRRLPGGLGDVIGELQSFDGGYAELRRSNGEIIRIDCDQIVASRVVRSR